MRALLRLDASAQVAQSHSRSLADRYEARWRERHVGGEVLVRDLARDPVPHLNDATVAMFYGGGASIDGSGAPGVALSDQLIAELKRVDDVVISSAVYNFNMPSALKAWIDHIVRLGHTVAFAEQGPVGLLADKRACFITARGGMQATTPDYQLPALQAVFAYIGIRETEAICLEGTRIPDGGLDVRICKAHDEIDSLFDRAIT